MFLKLLVQISLADLQERIFFGILHLGQNTFTLLFAFLSLPNYYTLHSSDFRLGLKRLLPTNLISRHRGSHFVEGHRSSSLH